MPVVVVVEVAAAAAALNNGSGSASSRSSSYSGSSGSSNNFRYYYIITIAFCGHFIITVIIIIIILLPVLFLLLLDLLLCCFCATYLHSFLSQIKKKISAIVKLAEILTSKALIEFLKVKGMRLGDYLCRFRSTSNNTRTIPLIILPSLLLLVVLTDLDLALLWVFPLFFSFAMQLFLF